MKVGDATKKPPPQTNIREEEDIDNCLAAVVNNILSFWKRWCWAPFSFSQTDTRYLELVHQDGAMSEGSGMSSCSSQDHEGGPVDQAKQYCDNLNSHLLEIYI